jgi:2'-5' RNA ligase
VNPTRTFISALPSDGSKKHIRWLGRSLLSAGGGIQELAPHCTLLYSKTIIPVATIRIPEIKFPIVVKDPMFDIFETKNDGNCLVLRFDCPEFMEINKYLTKRYNLMQDYDYHPHLTLIKNVQRYDNNLKNTICRAEIVFNKMAMDNGK